MPDEPTDRGAPEGARCAEHPTHPAIATCPRCGNYACLICWHHAVDRCHPCLSKEPGAAAPPIPWEDPNAGGVLARFVRTLGTAFRPVRTAPAFARPGLGPALRFAALTVLPIALLRGVIPLTHTLLFAPGFGLTLRGSPTAMDITLDVVRAMGLSLGLCLASVGAFAVPYVSLSRAYGASPLASVSALRLLLYRAWLVSLTGFLPGGLGLFTGFMVWALPEGAMAVVPLFMLAEMLVPLILFIIAMRTAARLSALTGPFASFVVMGIPLGLFMVVQPVLTMLVVPFLPAPPSG